MSKNFKKNDVEAERIRKKLRTDKADKEFMDALDKCQEFIDKSKAEQQEQQKQVH